MALINRISRLFRADFHAVLDHIEEPVLMLKQALREMEEAIHSDELQIKRLQNDVAEAEIKKEDIDKTLRQFETELDICFESNEFELAHRHIRRKLEMQRYENHLSKNIDLMKKLLTEVKQRVGENKLRFQSMQQKLDVFTEENTSYKETEFSYNSDFTVHDDEVEVEFLREKQSRGAV